MNIYTYNSRQMFGQNAAQISTAEQMMMENIAKNTQNKPVVRREQYKEKKKSRRLPDVIDTKDDELKTLVQKLARQTWDMPFRYDADRNEWYFRLTHLAIAHVMTDMVYDHIEWLAQQNLLPESRKWLDKVQESLRRFGNTLHAFGSYSADEMAVIDYIIDTVGSDMKKELPLLMINCDTMLKASAPVKDERDMYVRMMVILLILNNAYDATCIYDPRENVPVRKPSAAGLHFKTKKDVMLQNVDLLYAQQRFERMLDIELPDITKRELCDETYDPDGYFVKQTMLCCRAFNDKVLYWFKGDRPVRLGKKAMLSGFPNYDGMKDEDIIL